MAGGWSIAITAPGDGRFDDGKPLSGRGSRCTPTVLSRDHWPRRPHLEYRGACPAGRPPAATTSPPAPRSERSPAASSDCSSVMPCRPSSNHRPSSPPTRPARSAKDVNASTSSRGYNPRIGDQRDHSGQFRVRVPVELHAALAAEAERQGVSLNTLIVALLAGGIGWRAATPRPNQAPTQE
jgi:HicB family